MDVMEGYRYLMYFIVFFSVANIASSVVFGVVFYFGSFYSKYEKYYRIVVVSYLLLLFYALYSITYELS